MPQAQQNITEWVQSGYNDGPLLLYQYPQPFGKQLRLKSYQLEVPDRLPNDPQTEIIYPHAVTLSAVDTGGGASLGGSLAPSPLVHVIT